MVLDWGRIFNLRSCNKLKHFCYFMFQAQNLQTQAFSDSVVLSNVWITFTVLVPAQFHQIIRPYSPTRVSSACFSPILDLKWKSEACSSQKKGKIYSEKSFHFLLFTIVIKYLPKLNRGSYKNYLSVL